MKRIALMTWHHVSNYGTAFQALALKLILEKCSCEVHLIDYRRGQYPLVEKKRILSLLKEGSIYIGDCIRKKNSRQREEYKINDDIFNIFFEDYFTYSQPCTNIKSLKELNIQYEGFVCGSDQIWGPRWFDPTYYLDFVVDNRRKIAYAPSVGVTKLERFPAAREMRKLISEFSDISCREQSGCTEIADLTGRDDICNVLDPVLLIDREYWHNFSISSDYDIPKEKYMLVFLLKNNDQYYKAAISAAKEQNTKAIILHCTQSEDNQYANIDFPSPEGLLKLIENAEFVCTDSFHIMVFSIIFNTQFCVFNKFSTKEMSSQNKRLLDFLEKLQISDVVYIDHVGGKIDFKRVNSLLKFYKEDSFAYLKKAIDRLPDTVGKESQLENCNHVCMNKELNQSYYDYYRNHGKIARIFMDKHFLPFNFTLKEECYRCSRYIHIDTDLNIHKPLFYNDLVDDMKNNKSVLRIYWEYYLYYDLKYIISRILRNKA